MTTTTRYIALLALLAACAPKSNRADSVDAALPAIDTLKPVRESESQSESEKKASTPTQTQTQTAPRDSAFAPPRNLPQLDTVKKKP